MRLPHALVIALLAGLAGLACSEATPQGTGSSGGGTTAGTTAGTTSGSGGTTGGSTSGTGGTTGGGQDAGPVDAGFPIAPHLPLPQVLNHGGPILHNAKLVTITFGGYVFESQVQAFGDWIVGSSWLTAVGADYSVGLGTQFSKVVLDAGAPAQITSSQVEAFLGAQMDAGLLPDPASDDQLLYAIYYPDTTTITMDQGASGTSCQEFGGYHAEASTGAYDFVYAVIPTCSPSNPVLPSEISQVETSASHEFIEAATDPRVNHRPAYDITDMQNAWSFVPGEVGDLCNFQVTTAGPSGEYWVQRIWSNSAAAAGQNPCIPASLSPYYFNVSPSPSNIIPLVAGQPTDITLTGWSTGPMSPWFLVPSPGTIASFAGLQYTLDHQTISNGAQVTLTVTAPGSTASGNYATLDIFSFSADDGSIWPLVFVVQ